MSEKKIICLAVDDEPPALRLKAALVGGDLAGWQEDQADGSRLAELAVQLAEVVDDPSATAAAYRAAAWATIYGNPSASIRL